MAAELAKMTELVECPRCARTGNMIVNCPLCSKPRWHMGMYVGSTSGTVPPHIAAAYALLFTECGELPALVDVLRMRRELGDTE